MRLVCYGLVHSITIIIYIYFGDSVFHARVHEVVPLILMAVNRIASDIVLNFSVSIRLKKT